MDTIEITKLEKEPIVKFSNKEVVLPDDIQKKIDIYWQSLLDAGKKYTRGEVFTVTKKDELNDSFSILVEKTDYAHYLYCQNIDADVEGYGIRIIFTACFLDSLIMSKSICF